MTAKTANISATIEIAAPPEQVWAVLADLASYPEWNPVYREVYGQLTPGNKITIHSTQPATGHTMTIKVKVLTAQPATELRWVSSVLGLMTSEHSFILSPTSGGTQLVQTQTYRGMFTRFPPRPSAVSRPASRRSIKRSGSEPRTAAHEGPDVPVPGPGLNIQTGTKVVRYNKDDSAAPKGQ